VSLLLLLGVGVLALALICAGVWALIAWRRSRKTFDDVASRIYIESRLEQLTLQTLAAMRDATRRTGKP
jgi:hypothetical protein